MANIKKIYDLVIGLMAITFAFWVLYTVIFLFIEGWHWSPVSRAEIICDGIVKVAAQLNLIFWICVVALVINRIIQEKE